MGAFEYKYKNGAVHRVSAAVAGPICQRLHDAKILTPKNLVDEARPEDSPLHPEFDWDDSIAAEKWREEQARQVIKTIILYESDTQNERIVKLEEVSREEPEGFAGEDNTFMTGDRAFVSTGERNHRYVPIAVALTNDEWKANLLKDAKKDMQAFITKYHRLAELANIIDNMNKFLSA